jgi:hypothetical protein
MEHLKKSYKPKEEKLIKLKSYYTKLKQDETKKNKQSTNILFVNK